MPKDGPLALGAGLASAVIMLSVLGSGPKAAPLLYFAQLPLFLAGLSRGLGPALSAATIGALIVTLVGQSALGSSVFGVMFLVLLAVPVILVTRMAVLSRPGAGGGVEWYPPRLILSWLIAYASLGLVAAAILFSGVEDGLEWQVRDAYRYVVERVTNAPLSPELSRWLEGSARSLPGVLAGTWLSMTSLSAVAAQALLSRLRWSLRPSPRLIDLTVPHRLLAALFAALAVAIFAEGQVGFVGRNLLPVLLAPYFFVGLAVVHTVARRAQRPAIILAAFYGPLILLKVVVMVPLAILLGLLDTWVNLRRRFGGPGQV